MAAPVAAMATFRDAVNLAHLVAAADDAGDRTLKLTPAGLELDLVKGDAKPAWSDPFGIAAIVKVDIVEAEIIGLSANSAATSANGAAFHTPQFAAVMVSIPIAIPVMAAGIITIRAISTVTEIEMQSARLGLNRKTAADALARRAGIGQSRSGEEQRRRKGKRGCSRLHDAFHHGCRNAQTNSTKPERVIRVTFMKFRPCPFLAILS